MKDEFVNYRIDLSNVKAKKVRKKEKEYLMGAKKQWAIHPSFLFLPFAACTCNYLYNY
jgi:hypothetical protein